MDWRSHAPRLGTPSRAWQWWHTGEQQGGGGGQVWRLWASVAARQWKARAGQRAHIFSFFFRSKIIFEVSCLKVCLESLKIIVSR